MVKIIETPTLLTRERRQLKEDIEFMERKVEDIEKAMKRSNDKQLKIELECCEKVKAWLEGGKDVRLGEWKAAEAEILNTFQLLTAKPVVYLRFTMGKASGRKAAKKPMQNERLASLEDANSLVVNKMDAMMALILILNTKNPSVDGEEREGVRNNMESATRGRRRGLPMGAFMRESRNAGINPTIPTPLRVVGHGK
ncbi:hypothetical protein GIB67_022256 [Kingdonia uniflora]|uniref:Uncharacterized protein n=1 Tax=Kingdonia uniflora TaxID=39325 RepID=A0A7J7M793_9MAGN|nr:hypothetical protein GIB67_022256 [Kingdonia uniflora]